MRVLIFAIITIAMAQTVFSFTAHAQSTPGDLLFVTGSVDNERPYLGQQITYTFKIYQQSGTTLTFRSLRYEAPGFAGFWNSQKTEQDEYSEILDSIEYQVVEFRTVLFPSVVGTVAIDPAALAMSAEATSVDSRLESDAVAVEVLPLPAGAPSSFSGAVGRFEVSAVSDTTEGKVNEPVRLTFRISGEGNIEALPNPEWPQIAGWRVIESPVSSESRVEAGVMTGSRTYEFTLVPEIGGELTIPGIRYPHFDPVSGQYVQVGTSPVFVTVVGGEGLPSAQPPGEETTGDEEAALRPIKDIPVSLRRGGSELALIPTEQPCVLGRLGRTGSHCHRGRLHCGPSRTFRCPCAGEEANWRAALCTGPFGPYRFSLSPWHWRGVADGRSKKPLAPKPCGTVPCPTPRQPWRERGRPEGITGLLLRRPCCPTSPLALKHRQTD